jgi:mono/diheme cytochrome c family protein
MQRRTWLIGFVVLVAVAAGAFWLLTQPSLLPANVLSQRNANLENGRTMFNIGGCAACHATPVADAKPEDRLRLGGGLALKSPFGTFKVPNISTDPNTGIGRWTEIEFVNAMLRGVGRAGEHLYPAFPYTSYQRMRLDDVRDLFAYLRTLPAVDKPSEPHELPFPFNIRRGLGLWKLLYLDGKPYESSPARSARLNRGGYLVEGPGHCAECHSPRNFIGGIDPDRRFAGGPDPEGKGFVPNITPHADGLAKWTDKDISYLLETGQTPDGDAVGSTMADVAVNTGMLTADDRNAIAAYIKSLPPRPGKPKKE